MPAKPRPERISFDNPRFASYKGTPQRATTQEASFMSSASLRNLALYLLVCALFTTAALAQTDNWKGGAGNWSVAGNWSAGEPTSSSNVGIDAGNAKASPVILDVGGQASTLVIDSDDSLS